MFDYFTFHFWNFHLIILFIFWEFLFFTEVFYLFQVFVIVEVFSMTMSLKSLSYKSNLFVILVLMSVDYLFSLEIFQDLGIVSGFLLKWNIWGIIMRLWISLNLITPESEEIHHLGSFWFWPQSSFPSWAFVITHGWGPSLLPGMGRKSDPDWASPGITPERRRCPSVLPPHGLRWHFGVVLHRLILSYRSWLLCLIFPLSCTVLVWLISHDLSSVLWFFPLLR